MVAGGAVLALNIPLTSSIDLAACGLATVRWGAFCSHGIGGLLGSDACPS